MPFNNSESISNSIFELIHSDVWGPSPVGSIGGSQYFVIFIDDYFRYSWIFPMKYHSEILPIYSNFAKMVETQFSKRIKTFRSDNALEYTQYAFQALLHSYGTVHHLTCPGTFQQNGRAERKYVIFLTLFMLFLFLPKFLPLFGVKLLLMLFMQLIAFQALSSIIRLRISVSLGHLLTIITFDLLDLLVSFFFSLMNTTNLSLNLDFVVSLVMAKLKKGIGVMILSLIVFVFLVMLSFGNTDYLLNFLTSILP